MENIATSNQSSSRNAAAPRSKSAKTCPGAGVSIAKARFHDSRAELLRVDRKPHRSISPKPPESGPQRINYIIQLLSSRYLSFAAHAKVIMQTSLPSEGENSSDLFRPSKRRKFYRKRTDGEDEGSPIHSSAPPPESMTVDELISHQGRLTETQHHKTDEEPLSIAAILRQRKLALPRKGGIEFTNSHTSTSSTSQTSDALIVKEDDTPADIKSVIERFAPQTGQVSDVADKHMYAFPPPTLD